LVLPWFSEMKIKKRQHPFWHLWASCFFCAHSCTSYCPFLYVFTSLSSINLCKLINISRCSIWDDWGWTSFKFECLNYLIIFCKWSISTRQVKSCIFYVWDGVSYLKMLLCSIWNAYINIAHINLTVYQNLPGKSCRIEKNPIMISPYSIFEVNKLLHDEIF
jgi:hypothetical protein